MEYQVNPDGTVSFIKSLDMGITDSDELTEQEMIERMGTYDTHKLFN